MEGNACSNWFFNHSLFNTLILAYINVRPLLGTDVLKSPPHPPCLGLVPICFFFNAYCHTSGLMGYMGSSLQKGPLGLLESLLIVLCHSVFKNSLVQCLFTVNAICSGCFPEISQALWKTSILSEKKKCSFQWGVGVRTSITSWLWKCEPICWWFSDR